MRVVGLGNAFPYDSLIHTISFFKISDVLVACNMEASVASQSLKARVLYLSQIYISQMLACAKWNILKQEERWDARTLL